MYNQTKDMTMTARLFPTLLLIAVILAACSPAQTIQPSAMPPIAELPSATPATIAEGNATQHPVVNEAPTQAVLPIATSRGPDLHATDPTTVILASGQYQFVEFFRFT